MFSSTAEAAEYQGDALGEFVRSGRHNNRPYYKQRDTEGSEDVYVYSNSEGWWVSKIVGLSNGWMKNDQDTDLPPRANWLYRKDGKWNDDDQTLTLDNTTLSHHKLVTVAGSGCGLNHQESRMGDYRFASTTSVLKLLQHMNKISNH